jgi:hypothetical protein
MRVDRFTFGSIRIDDVTYEQEVVIDRGKIRTRRKKPSKRFRDTFGHTPLSGEEKIPWKCRRLVAGTGAWRPARDGRSQTGCRPPQLILPTASAIEALRTEPEDNNAILHVTC